MITVAGVLVALLTVPLAGGRLSGLLQIRLRARWLLVVALAVQILITAVVAGSVSPTLLEVVHVLTYVPAAAFVVANRATPGMRTIGVGGALNLVAIVANGGVMPASPAALRMAGLDAIEGFANSAAVADARVAWLGDVFAVPASWPLANVYSLGDIVLVVGGAVLIHAATGTRWSTAAPRGGRPTASTQAPAPVVPAPR